jgi:hypothetical protein
VGKERRCAIHLWVRIVAMSIPCKHAPRSHQLYVSKTPKIATGLGRSAKFVPGHAERGLNEIPLPATSSRPKDTNQAYEIWSQCARSPSSACIHPRW